MATDNPVMRSLQVVPGFHLRPNGFVNRNRMVNFALKPSSLLKSDELHFNMKNTVTVIPVFWFINIKRKKKKSKLQNAAVLLSSPPPQNGTSLETMKLHPRIQVLREEPSGVPEGWRLLYK